MGGISSCAKRSTILFLRMAAMVSFTAWLQCLKIVKNTGCILSHRMQII